MVREIYAVATESHTCNSTLASFIQVDDDGLFCISSSIPNTIESYIALMSSRYFDSYGGVGCGGVCGAESKDADVTPTQRTIIVVDALSPLISSLAQSFGMVVSDSGIRSFASSSHMTSRKLRQRSC